jgi:hypothetical protein
LKITRFSLNRRKRSVKLVYRRSQKRVNGQASSKQCVIISNQSIMNLGIERSTILLLIFINNCRANDIKLLKFENCTSSGIHLTVLRCDIVDNKGNLIINITRPTHEVMVSFLLNSCSIYVIYSFKHSIGLFYKEKNKFRQIFATSPGE